MKKNVVYIGLFVLALVALVAGNGLLNKVAMPNEDKVIEDELRKMLEGTKFPAQIDKDTRLDAVIPGPGRKVTYVYTLVNDSIVTLDTNKFAEVMSPSLKEDYQKKEGLAGFRENRIAIGYVYRDKHSNEVMRLTVSPEAVPAPAR